MHNTPILHIEYHCGLLLFGFFLSLEMSSKFKGPNEVDLFQQTCQVQEIAQRGEKDVAAAKEGAVYPGMHMSMTDFTGEGFFTCSCHLSSPWDAVKRHMSY